MGKRQWRTMILFRSAKRFVNGQRPLKFASAAISFKRATLASAQVAAAQCCSDVCVALAYASGQKPKHVVELKVFDEGYSDE